MVWEWEWFTGLHMQGETDPVAELGHNKKKRRGKVTSTGFQWRILCMEACLSRGVRSGLVVGGLVGWLVSGRGVRVVLVLGSLVGEPKPGRLGVEREAHALSRVTEPPLAGLSSTAKRAKRWEIGRIRYSVCWVVASVKVVLKKIWQINPEKNLLDSELIGQE